MLAGGRSEERRGESGEVDREHECTREMICFIALYISTLLYVFHV